MNIIACIPPSANGAPPFTVLDLAQSESFPLIRFQEHLPIPLFSCYCSHVSTEKMPRPEILTGRCRASRRQRSWQTLVPVSDFNRTIQINRCHCFSPVARPAFSSPRRLIQTVTSYSTRCRTWRDSNPQLPVEIIHPAMTRQSFEQNCPRATWWICRRRRLIANPARRIAVWPASP
jgi:hypothetical protein